MRFCNETPSNCFLLLDPPTLPYRSTHPLDDQCNTGQCKGCIGGYDVDPIRLLVSTMMEFSPLVLICT